MATCAISATANVIPVSGQRETNRDDSERSLVQRAQAGDEQAFATLFQLHKKRVYSVCLLMTKGHCRSRRSDPGSVPASVSQRQLIPGRLGLFHLAIPRSGKHGAHEVAPPQGSSHRLAG